MKKKIISKFKSLILYPITILIYFSRAYSNILSRFTKKLYFEDEIEGNQKKYSTLKLDSDLELKFYIVNSITKFRAETFFDKEPDTLQWIKNYNGNGDLIDIGANIGIYSNYFAKIKKGNVFAFECSFYNLSILAENCQLNKNENKITIYPFPLYQKNKNGFFKINNPIIGGALSSFDVNYGHDGKIIENYSQYLLPGFSLDFLIENKIINTVPSLIKIDVDGVEDLILRGAKNLLNSNLCKSVLVEVNEDFHKQYENIQQIMIDNNFKLSSTGKKTYLKDLNQNEDFKKTYNQIWIKD